MNRPLTSPASPHALPAYTVRTSARARRARLSYDPRFGLTVVVPTRFDQRRVAGIIEANSDWIERTAVRFGARRVDPLVDGPYPRRIVLAALGEEWSVDYEPAPRPVRVRAVAPRRLRVAGGTVGPPQDAHRALQAWVTRRAAAAFAPQVRALADELGVAQRLGRVTIRAQKSRWGSCSARGAVSLNRALLFLPPHLCRVVLAHEACHLRELNHSPAFWSLLSDLEPRARELRAELVAAWQHVPSWADRT